MPWISDVAVGIFTHADNVNVSPISLVPASIEWIRPKAAPVPTMPFVWPGATPLVAVKFSVESRNGNAPSFKW